MNYKISVQINCSSVILWPCRYSNGMPQLPFDEIINKLILSD